MIPKAVLGSGAPATLDRWSDFPDVIPNPDEWWRTSERGDHMLWVAEISKVPDRQIGQALLLVVSLAEELHLSLMRDTSKNKPECRSWYDADTYTSAGRNSRHAYAHRYHGMADCLHSKACAHHWLSHRGGGYPALCAMHYHDAKMMADFKLGRDAALKEAQLQTAIAVRTHIPSLTLVGQL